MTTQIHIPKPGPFLFSLTRLWNFDKTTDKPAQCQAQTPYTSEAAPELKGLRGDKPQTAELMIFSKPSHNSFRSFSKHPPLSCPGRFLELNTEHLEEAEPNPVDLALWIHNGEEQDALGSAGTRVQSLRGPFWSQNL